MVVAHLERTRDAFVAATLGLTEAQYAFSAGSGSWSIGEIVEHVALAELRMLDLAATKLPEAAGPSGDRPSGAARFARLDAVVPSREQRRIEAPDVLRPTGRWPSPAVALAVFVDARDRAIAAAAAAGPDVGNRVLPHRFFGELDLEEWLYFTSLHCARHTAQVLEVKRAVGFPA